jgi:hypothetical protein
MPVVLIGIMIVMGMQSSYDKNKSEKEKHAVVEQLKQCQEKCASK